MRLSLRFEARTSGTCLCPQTKLGEMRLKLQSGPDASTSSLVALNLSSCTAVRQVCGGEHWGDGALRTTKPGGHWGRPLGAPARVHCALRFICLGEQRTQKAGGRLASGKPWQDSAVLRHGHTKQVVQSRNQAARHPHVLRKDPELDAQALRLSQQASACVTALLS